MINGWMNIKYIIIKNINICVILTFIILLLYLTTLFTTSVNRDDTTCPTIIPIPDNDSTQGPLIAPFYPTIESIHLLDTFEMLQLHLFCFEEPEKAEPSDVDIPSLLDVDCSVSCLGNGDPAILIFHTHSQEAYSDSRPGVVGDTIVGVGDVLADILADDYGITVVHDRGQYDMVDGTVTREGSYDRMQPAVLAILEKYPSISATIDMHRDGVPDDMRLVADIGGMPTARVMFVNGLSQTLDNPYVNRTIALSLQMQLMINELYPGFARRIYIKPYRYSLFMKPKSILVEVGANTSTVEEAKNAMGPLAEILVGTLTRG